MSDPNKEPESQAAEARPRRGLTRGRAVLLVLLLAAAVVFCPKKLSWLYGGSSVDQFLYLLDVRAEDGSHTHERVRSFIPVDDPEAVRARMEDTWVVWTGWTNVVYSVDVLKVLPCAGERHMDMLSGFFYPEGNTGSLSPVLRALNNERAIYIDRGSRWSRYQSLGLSLMELVLPEGG